MDLGCGTGQNSRLLAPHFQQVVGMDISESQLEEARAVQGFPTLSYKLVMHIMKDTTLKYKTIFSYFYTNETFILYDLYITLK